MKLSLIIFKLKSTFGIKFKFMIILNVSITFLNLDDLYYVVYIYDWKYSIQFIVQYLGLLSQLHFCSI